MESGKLGLGGERWKRIESRDILDCKIFRVVERTNESPEGKVGRFTVLAAPEWATVVPLVEGPEGKSFVMVRQYRHGSDEVSVEFPGGVVEPGEEPAAAAARELEEETGYRPRALRPLGSTFPNPAFMDNQYHVFLAEGCEPTGRIELDEHEIVDVLLVPVEEVRERMGRAPYDHALMLAALFLADRALRAE